VEAGHLLMMLQVLPFGGACIAKGQGMTRKYCRWGAFFLYCPERVVAAPVLK